MSLRTIEAQSQRLVYRYRVIARILRFRFQKDISMNTKVLWRRNIVKCETSQVPHIGLESVFNDTLEMQLDFVYNRGLQRFENNHTQFCVYVMWNGKIKSGGFAKFNAADVVNDKYEHQSPKILVTKCPDPNAFIEIAFDYDLIQSNGKVLRDELSQLNVSSRSHHKENDQPGSVTRKSCKRAVSAKVLKQRKQNELQRMNSSKNIKKVTVKENQFQKMAKIVQRYQELVRKVKKMLNLKEYPNCQITLSEQTSKFPKTLRLYEQETKDKAALVTILQEKLKAKSKEYDLLEEKASRHKQLAKALRDSEKKCRNKLEKAMGELGRLLKDDADGELLLKSILEEEAPSREQNQQEELLERIRDLEEDNMQLTKQIAESTFKLAVIFNSAQEKGGNKLVEFLQHSIGIRE